MIYKLIYADADDHVTELESENIAELVQDIIDLSGDADTVKEQENELFKANGHRLSDIYGNTYHIEVEEQEFAVSIAVDMRIDVKVKAKDAKEAERLALAEFGSTEINLNDGEVIDYIAVNAMDENDNLYDY